MFLWSSPGVLIPLMQMTQTMRTMSEVLMRMRERCDPYLFYHRIRKYLTGSENCDALPQGLFYGDEPEPRRYSVARSFLSGPNLH